MKPGEAITQSKRTRTDISTETGLHENWIRHLMSFHWL